MKILRQAKLFLEWLFDWYVLPVIESLKPQPKADTPKDNGLTLGDE